MFDVLGKLQFDGKLLRDLLIEAVRYGDQPEVRARLTRAIEDGVDRPHLEGLIEDRALAKDVMDSSRVARIREEMERAEARRLQPHYIESFFLEALKRLGGTVRQREPHRYEVTHVPATVRNRDRQTGTGDPVLARYERIAFEKDLIAVTGQPLAAFVCPGHPLLDAVLDLTIERHRDLLRRGTVLVDERDPGTSPRVLLTLEHAIQDASLLPSGERRAISRRMLYVEVDAAGTIRNPPSAPYLDYRPLADGEPSAADLLARPECAWIAGDLERTALGYAIANVVPGHLAEVRDRRLAWIEKTRAAVKDRLTKEISYWDHRAEQLKLQEQAGKAGARLNSQEARRRADDLQARLQTAPGRAGPRGPGLGAAARRARRPGDRAARAGGRDDRTRRRQPTRSRPRRQRLVPAPSSWRRSATWASSRPIASSSSSATTSRAACPAPGGCASSRSRGGWPARTSSP